MSIKYKEQYLPIKFEMIFSVDENIIERLVGEKSASISTVLIDQLIDQLIEKHKHNP